jgi:hypothetical protein
VPESCVGHRTGRNEFDSNGDTEMKRDTALCVATTEASEPAPVGTQVVLDLYDCETGNGRPQWSGRRS